MLRFSTGTDNSKLSAYRSQPIDSTAKKSSKVGKSFYEDTNSEKTNKSRSSWLTILLGVGAVSLAAACTLLILDVAVVYFASAFALGLTAMMGIPAINYYYGTPKPVTETGKAVESAVPPAKPSQLQKLDNLLEESPKTRQAESRGPLQSEAPESDDEDLHSVEEEEFSDDCPPATEDEFGGIFGFDPAKAARALKKRFR